MNKKVIINILFILFIFIWIISLFLIIAMPTNKYEWMYDDSDIKSIPGDPNALFYAMIALLPLPLVFGATVAIILVQKKIYYIIPFCILVLLWLIKFIIL